MSGELVAAVLGAIIGVAWKLRQRAMRDADRLALAMMRADDREAEFYDAVEVAADPDHR